MTKPSKNQFLATFFLLVMPFFSFAQGFGNETDDIDPPPPSAPIDEYVIPFVFVAILIATLYFFKTNLKSLRK
jgi:hypothetical protein